MGLSSLLFVLIVVCCGEQDGVAPFPRKEFFLARGLVGVGSSGLYRSVAHFNAAFGQEGLPVESTLEFWVWLLPSSFSSFRMLALFGESWGLAASSDMMLLFCANGQQNVHLLPFSLVGKWSHFRISSTLSHGIVVDVDKGAMRFAFSECRPSASFSGFYLGPSPMHANMPTRGLFFGAKFKTFIGGEYNMASVPPEIPWEEVTNATEAIAFAEVETFENHEFARRHYFQCVGQIKDPMCLSRLATLDGSVVYHSLAVAQGDVVDSMLALASAFEEVCFSVRLHYAMAAAGRLVMDLKSSTAIQYRSLRFLKRFDPQMLERPVAQEASQDMVLDAFKYAAEGGDAKAQLSMGEIYFHGLRGMEQNAEAALGYFEKAAAQGNVQAKIHLAKAKMLLGVNVSMAEEVAKNEEAFYQEADGVALMGHVAAEAGGDAARALELFSEAARMETAQPAHHANAGILAKALNSNLTFARESLERAAYSGEPVAMYHLGVMYVAGEGGPLRLQDGFGLFAALNRRALMTSFAVKAQECYVEGNMKCAFWQLLLAGEQGLPEAALDAAEILVWKQKEADLLLWGVRNFQSNSERETSWVTVVTTEEELDGLDEKESKFAKGEFGAAIMKLYRLKNGNWLEMAATHNVSEAHFMKGWECREEGNYTCAKEWFRKIVQQHDMIGSALMFLVTIEENTMRIVAMATAAVIFSFLISKLR